MLGVLSVMGQGAKRWAVVYFATEDGDDAREIPSASLRAGSSLRLRNGCVQEDAT
jgi:hypothetical protein